MGNLGKAIALHINFESKGFRLIGLFDKKEALVGQIIKNMPVRSVLSRDEFCRENLPQVAVLCIPKEEAEAVSSQLMALGVKAFWNFSHYDLAINNPGISVENVHLGDSLMKLSYGMNR